MRPIGGLGWEENPSMVGAWRKMTLKKFLWRFVQAFRTSLDIFCVDIFVEWTHFYNKNAVFLIHLVKGDN